MVFGIGVGLFFVYMPFIKLGPFKLSSFRTRPGTLFGRVCRNLGLKPTVRRFRNRQYAMRELDSALTRGVPVGVTTSPFWLPYMTAAMRIHFNAHNLVVYGKEDEEYLVSDTVFLDPVRCPEKDLEAARFAAGFMAPRGHMYHLESGPVPRRPPDLAGPIVRSIRGTCRTMLHIPVPMVGVRGIRYLAAQVRKWPQSAGAEELRMNFNDIVMTQELTGTGGGGFRFMYAAFLKEAASWLGRPDLADVSVEMTAIGDLWRDFATRASRFCKNRLGPDERYDDLYSILIDLADREEHAYRRLESILPAGGATP